GFSGNRNRNLIEIIPFRKTRIGKTKKQEPKTH
ncbi:MAG: hypothetical protein ACI81W_003890, partial [Saprospiraceae bacterium]